MEKKTVVLQYFKIGGFHLKSLKASTNFSYRLVNVTGTKNDPL